MNQYGEDHLRPPALSAAAALLLRTLRDHGATRRAAALTDAVLAQRTGIPQRDVIDYARELLAAGYLVAATCKSPHGRFFVLPGDADGIREAEAELDVLEGRALGIHARTKWVRECLANYKRGMFPLDSSGQFTLFDAASNAPQNPGRFMR